MIANSLIIIGWLLMVRYPKMIVINQSVYVGVALQETYAPAVMQPVPEEWTKLLDRSGV